MSSIAQYCPWNVINTDHTTHSTNVYGPLRTMALLQQQKYYVSPYKDKV